MQYSGKGGGGLPDWGKFILDKYTEAVQGLVKSDLPTDDEIISYILLVQSFAGSDVPSAPGFEPPHSWNLVYGVVDSYAVFNKPDSYPVSPPPSSAPSHMIDLLVPDLSIYYIQFPDDISQIPTELSPTCAWVRARVNLGLMARWKALYLLIGYDKVWSVLQNMRFLTNLPPDPEPLANLPPDRTKANGNWSVRELYNTVSEVLRTTGSVALAPCLSDLMLALDMIAKGKWSGPARGRLSRPACFRDCLARAAL
jgi:hypothetical protein